MSQPLGDASHETLSGSDRAPEQTPEEIMSQSTVPNMHRIHSAFSAFEAYLYRDRLRASGVAAQVRNEGLTGALGELPAQEVMIEVWVPRDSVEKAQAIIEPLLHDENYRAQETAGANAQHGEKSASPATTWTPPERCPRCDSPWEPGFDTCWNCCETLLFD